MWPRFRGFVEIYPKSESKGKKNIWGSTDTFVTARVVTARTADLKKVRDFVDIPGPNKSPMTAMMEGPKTPPPLVPEIR